MFSRIFLTFQDEYEQCLVYYLADNSKQNSKNAREIGLKAVSDKIELIDISKIHHNALNKVLEQQKTVKDCLLIISRSEQFLQEVLTSFEDKSSELEKANTELATFSRILTHDLCSPLRNITAFGEILKKESATALSDRGKDFLSRMILSSQKTNKLIDSLLELATMTKKELALGTVNLSDIAREVVADLRSKDPDRNVNVSIADNVVAKGDNGLIKQVLGYLMENAWKFTRKVKDAKIEFGTMVKGKDNVYFVKDNGAGFDNKYSDKLFSAFQRLHTEEEFAGPGLGLYTAKKIIEKHGGDIWAEAEEDKGAAFYFTINV